MSYLTNVNPRDHCQTRPSIFYHNEEADTQQITFSNYGLSFHLEKFTDIKRSILIQFVSGKIKIKTQVPRFNSPKMIKLSSFASETNYSDVQFPHKLLACLTVLGLCLLHQFHYFFS